jgi:hypothetical protein
VERIPDGRIEQIRQAEGADLGWFAYPQALQLDMVEDKKAILAAVFEYIHRTIQRGATDPQQLLAILTPPGGDCPL